MRLTRHLTYLFLSAITAAGLTACGGGDGSSFSPTPAVVVSGTAATGAAIVSGAITLKCVSGSASTATTGTDGRFTVDVTGVTLPCMLRVSYKDASGVPQVLHSLATIAGNVNITPLTELLVSNLTGAVPTTIFNSFDATRANAATAAQITAATAAVKTYLANLGAATTNLPADLIGANFTPANGSTVGDSVDKVLDDLAAKLKASGLTLADAVLAMARSGVGVAPPTPTTTPTPTPTPTTPPAGSLASKLGASFAGSYVLRCGVTGGGAVDHTIVINADGSSTLDGAVVVDGSNTGEIIVSNRIAHGFSAYRQAGTTFSPSFALQFAPTNSNAIDTTLSSQVNNAACSGISGAISAPVNYAGIVGSYARTGTVNCPSNSVSGVPSGVTSYTVAADGSFTLGTTSLTPTQYRDGSYSNVFDDAATFSQFRTSAPAITYQRLRVGQYSNNTATSLALVLDLAGATSTVEYSIKGQSNTCTR